MKYSMPFPHNELHCFSVRTYPHESALTLFLQLGVGPGAKGLFTHAECDEGFGAGVFMRLGVFFILARGRTIVR